MRFRGQRNAGRGLGLGVVPGSGGTGHLAGGGSGGRARPPRHTGAEEDEFVILTDQFTCGKTGETGRSRHNSHCGRRH